jgi:hypothetical protein
LAPREQGGDADIVELVRVGTVADQTLGAREDVVCEAVGVLGGERRTQNGLGEGAKEIGVAAGECGGVAGGAERFDERTSTS